MDYLPFAVLVFVSCFVANSHFGTRVFMQVANRRLDNARVGTLMGLDGPEIPKATLATALAGGMVILSRVLVLGLVSEYASLGPPGALAMLVGIAEIGLAVLWPFLLLRWTSNVGS